MKSFRTCLKGLGTMFRPVRWKIYISIFIGLARIAASLGFVWICKRLIDIATGNVGASLWGNIGLMIAIMSFQLLCNIVANWWNSYINVKVKNEERYRIFNHVIRSTWSGREAFHSGDTINRLEEDIRVVVDLLCTSFPSVVITFCQLVAAAFFLLSMAPTLVWILIALMVVAAAGSKMFFKVLRKLSAAIRERESEIQGYMQENLQNRVVVLTLVGVEKVMTRLGWMQEDVVHNTVKRMNYNSVARALMSLGFMLGYASAFIWGIVGIKENTVTYGMMTAFLQLVGQIQSPIAQIAQQIPSFIHSLTSVERLMELNELKTEEDGEPEKIDGAPEIEIKGITFAYPIQTHKVLSDFSCVFPSGTMTAVIGHTGAGKSTLIRLILALLKPEKGEILIDGRPANARLRCNFMYVPQGNTLMSGTIRENLQLSNSSATEEEMIDALKIAAADFVLKLPDGLDTVCSERGSGLSEGQAQRIAIARGLLHTGGVLILDEATSSVDSVTEECILKNLNARFHGRKTIIFISHREAVTRSADFILNMD